jgi:hypothetical protein
MSDVQVEAGMEWVATRLNGLGEGQRASIVPLEWRPDPLHLQPARHNFVILLNGRIQPVPFDDADLEDLPEHPRLQLQVEGELRVLLNDQLRGSDLVG